MVLEGIKIALGTFEMISQAVWEHRREHHGRYPRMLVLHPWVLDDLVYELTTLNKLQIYMTNLDDPRKDPTFMGVLSLIDFQATRAKIVDVNNEVIYI